MGRTKGVPNKPKATEPVRNPANIVVIPDVVPVFNSELRGDLLDRMLYKVRLLTDEAGSAREIQQLSMAVGILIDRRRLEEGDSTGRDEKIVAEAIRAKLRDRITKVMLKDGGHVPEGINVPDEIHAELRKQPGETEHWTEGHGARKRTG